MTTKSLRQAVARGGSRAIDSSTRGRVVLRVSAGEQSGEQSVKRPPTPLRVSAGTQSDRHHWTIIPLGCWVGATEG
ncbi:hypothetical protein N7536_009641 [Penicillium majusculum]|nr:hypothetical protein N7536_009641 [Penicillium majusculum]